jgi:hypothetical protein
VFQRPARGSRPDTPAPSSQFGVGATPTPVADEVAAPVDEASPVNPVRSQVIR